MLDVDTDDLIADHSEILILVVLYRGSASRTGETCVKRGVIGTGIDSFPLATCDPFCS